MPTSATPRQRIDWSPTLIQDRHHFDQVVLGGMTRARVSLAIATADLKTMLIPGPAGSRPRSILKLLSQMARRGVEVRVLHGGIPSRPVLAQLRRAPLPANLTLRRCPRMHAKAVVVDGQVMYLGSANLTGAGMGAKGPDRRNFELGIWTRQAELIDGVLSHFNGVWEGRHCAACRRRTICPVPLEEPVRG